MKHLYSTLIGLVTLVITSCGDYVAVQKTPDQDYKYEAAKQYYVEGHYNKAITILEPIISTYKGTDRGEESLYMLAMSNFKTKFYDAAAVYFKKYYDSYPKGLYTEEAMYYSAKSKQLGSPEPRLDQTDTYGAVSEFSDFLDAYPQSKYRDDVVNQIFELQDKLVEKEYLNAKLYYDLGSYFGNCTNGGSNYQACIITAENAIKDYPYSKRREALSILILRAKFELAEQSVDEKKTERYNATIDEYYGFASEYPESDFMPKAKQIFEAAKKYASEEYLNEAQ